MITTHTTAVTNQKGGVSKTATALNMVGDLSEAGKSGLLVDLDPQGHLTDGLGIDQASTGEGSANLYSALIGAYADSVADLMARHHAPAEWLELVPILTTNALAAADGVLIPVQAKVSAALRLLLPQIASADTDLREKPLELHGLVVSPLRRPTTKLAESVLEELDKPDGLPIVGTALLGVVVTATWRSGRTVVDYPPESVHAQAPGALAKTLAGGQ
ncbi:ParA family protein [Streptomyces sp. NPDC048514]|uniref:ParA family protein n=1 Tax=Streptomyces sp. NPDC048514 TaxID=3365564 RepID=UPI0037176B90